MNEYTQVYADAEELSRQMAAWIAKAIREHQGPCFRIALSGGTTIGGLYRELAKNAVPWSKVQIYWIDERFVPHDHADSNYRLVRETLLSAVTIAPENVHPMSTEGDPDEAAMAYEAILKHHYGAAELDPSRPIFDLVLLGLGPDGHFCSLLPGSPVLDERVRWVAPVPKGRPEVRLTLTYPAVQSTACAAYFLTGAGKAAVVKAVRQRDLSLPAARFHPNGSLVWFMDEPAATML